MDIFRKVNAVQLYLFWRNLAVSLLVFVATIAFSQMLPPFLSSVVSLVCAGVLYSMMYTNKIYHNSSCMIIVYAFFLILMTYTFFTITLNLLFYLRIVDTSWNFILFEIDPFLPSLVLIPIGTIVLAYIYLRSGKLALCTDCKISRGDMYSRGKLGFILNQEAKYQLRNLLSLFFSLSLIMWTYYLLFYININVNSRDKYVFIWLAVICFIIDEIYFIFRYYNLYMDLMENDEVLNEEDLESISNTIYLRVYIISGNSVYVNPDTPALDNPEKNVIDTPFFFKVPEYEIDNNEKVSEYVGNMIGYKNGELKPFFKQRNRDMNSVQRIDRYFYFIDIEPDKQLKLQGEWMNYDLIQHIYSTNPGKLASLSVSDTTRLATIILTEKTFDETGKRKFKIKKYRPSFNLYEVRNSELDFQDDKWIRVSLFNSDVRFYRIKKLWYKIVNDTKRYSKSSD